MSRTMRWSATVLVLACLTAGAAQAWPLAPSRSDVATPEVASRLEAVWDWLVSLFRSEDLKPQGQIPSGAEEKEGCSGNPLGNPVCG